MKKDIEAEKNKLTKGNTQTKNKQP